MTIRIENLTIDRSVSTWLDFPGATSIIGSKKAVLALVRHIMRDRGDCNIIPVVHAAVLHPVNEWGDNVQIEVTYSRRGYRAVYGARMENGRITAFQCYMD